MFTSIPQVSSGNVVEKSGSFYKVLEEVVFVGSYISLGP